MFSKCDLLTRFTDTKEVKDRFQRFCQYVGPFGMRHQGRRRIQELPISPTETAQISCGRLFAIQSGAGVSPGAGYAAVEGKSFAATP
jgi:hypothetical protein